jgi:hypothetical protein
MSIKNRYADTTYAAEAITAFDTALTAANTQFADLPTVDAPTVDRLAKMGLKSGSFAREALDLARLHDDLLPRALSVPKMQAAIDNRDLLLSRLAQVDHLRERIRVAAILHGVDSYTDALAVYNSLQRNGTDASLREAVAHLGRIFKRNNGEEEAPAPSAPATTGPSNP